MKKKNILIGILIIGVLFGLYNSLNLAESRRYANQQFQYCLMETSSEFLQDYSKMDESEKNKHYYNIVSNLYCALAIKDVSSYKEVGNISSLVGLYNLTYTNKDINVNEDVRRKIESYGDKLSRILLDLSINPKDNNKWRELSDLVKEIESKK